MERLTEEKQIGPFASLKDKAEAVPGAFATYDCLYAHMVAVTRLKEYEDAMPLERAQELAQAEKAGQLVLLQERATMCELQEMYRKAMHQANRCPPCFDYPSGKSIGIGIGVINVLDKILPPKEIDAALREEWLAYRHKPEENK